MNPGIPEAAIDEGLKNLNRRQAGSLIAGNREVDAIVRNGVRVKYKDESGRERNERIQVIDFKNPGSSNNEFLAVTQLWIQSTGATAKAAFRRPDIILYVNGLPLVFIELKNSSVKLKTAYDDNLTNYKADIPQLFCPTPLCFVQRPRD